MRLDTIKNKQLNQKWAEDLNKPFLQKGEFTRLRSKSKFTVGHRAQGGRRRRERYRNEQLFPHT